VVADRGGIPRAWQLAGLISIGALPCYLALRRTVVPAAVAPVPAEP